MVCRVVSPPCSQKPLQSRALGAETGGTSPHRFPGTWDNSWRHQDHGHRAPRETKVSLDGTRQLALHPGHVQQQLFASRPSTPSPGPSRRELHPRTPKAKSEVCVSPSCSKHPATCKCRKKIYILLSHLKKHWVLLETLNSKAVICSRLLPSKLPTAEVA